VTLDELKAALDTFSPAKVAFAARIIDALSNPPSVDVKSAGTWLTDFDDWIEYFGLALSVHHGATTDPLGLNAFETVFRNACKHMEWQVDPAGSATRRFVDAVVTPGNAPARRLSLKSTAAMSLSKTSVLISKLTEAAWIQDARTPRDRRQRTRDLFRDYRQAVSHIVMLRAFRREAGEVPFLYQLVEIPASIFESIENAPLDVFEPDAPKIECRVGGDVVAVVAMDRSDAKITVRGIRLSACTVHAEWRRG